MPQMNLTVTGRHVEVTDSLKRYATEKLDHVVRHFDHVTTCHLILAVEKHQQKAECTLHVKGRDIHAEATGSDLYAAIDAMIDKLDRQVRKHKEIVTDHHNGG
ncbi:MAG: ribosome-associated translation inhibitor RaiA [Hydrogenophilus sp.]|nr:ribosome-associated translation inhibitor RaiA [Hydrogenophilus sp.]